MHSVLIKENGSHCRGVLIEHIEHYLCMDSNRAYRVWIDSNRCVTLPEGFAFIQCSTVLYKWSSYFHLILR